MADRFAGFGPAALEFLEGLEADNTRAYFDRNRTTYQAELALPAKALVPAVAASLTRSGFVDVHETDACASGHGVYPERHAMMSEACRPGIGSGQTHSMAPGFTIREAR